MNQFIWFDKQNNDKRTLLNGVAKSGQTGLILSSK